MRAPLLELDEVTISYGPVIAVRELSLLVREGEIVALLGANGAGKSSTLAAIMGLVAPVKGSVRLKGREIAGRATESIVRLGATLVPEGRRVFANLSVLENLRLGGAALSRADYQREADVMFELFPVLAKRRNERAGNFSGGEQQQLAIARALMSRPRLMLLDEPSLGLAPKIATQVLDFVVRLRKRGVTVLLVEQNVERALEIADRAYVLSAGELRFSGESSTLDAVAIEDAYLGLRAEEAR